MSYPATTAEGEQVLAIDKGYAGTREIIETDDGRYFENKPGEGGLVPYEGALPISMVKTEEQAANVENENDEPQPAEDPEDAILGEPTAYSPGYNFTSPGDTA